MPEETRPNPSPSEPDAGASQPDDILEIIRNVEVQLDQLKNARSDHERMFQSMLHQQTDLEQQDHALADRARRLDERAESIQAQEKDHAERAATLDRRAAELADAEQEIAEQGRSISEREDVVALREKETVEQQQAFEHQFAEILDQAQRFKAELAEFSKSRADLEGETRRLKATAEKLEADLRVVEDERALLERDNARLREELEAAASEQGDQTAGAVDALKQSLESRESQVAELMEKLDAAHAEAARLREAFEGLGSRDAELARVHEELESLRAAAGDAPRLADELESLRAERDALMQRLDAEPAASTENLEGLSADLAGAAQHAETLAAAGEGLQRLHELLQNQNLSAEASAELDAEVANQRSRADAARADAEELRQKLEAAQQEIENLKVIPEAPAADPDQPVAEQVAKRDKIIEQLTAQLKDAEDQRAAAMNRPTAPRDPSADQQRRDRLKAMRNSLRDKAARLAQAKEMIEQRQQEVENILRLRSDLAAQREALAREKADLSKHSTKSGSGVAALCAAVAMLALAPLAWKAAAVFAPADHLASARIALASRNDDPVSPERRESFQITISELVNDPKLLDAAATRMNRRGIETYADAPALSAALRKNLDVSFPEPGAAEITLVDKGALLTQRVLETYLAALVSAVNDQSAARMDNAAVVVKDAPDHASPVNQTKQAVAAAGIWAGASLVTLAFIALVAVAMTKTRERIRNEEAMLQAARDGSGIGWAGAPPN